MRSINSMDFISIEQILLSIDGIPSIDSKIHRVSIERTDLLLIDSMDFVAKKCKYRIFDAKICKYSLIDSFLRIVAVSDNAAN